MHYREVIALLHLILCFSASTIHAQQGSAPNLYWFVPDGLRADPQVFDVFRWAQEGKLPNIKTMMENGAWGYSRPAFPSHTPSNFATLMTGSYPEVHGIADGPMRAEGLPLQKPSINGFSSASKKIPPLWMDLEKSGLKVYLLSVPGSTPPELEDGTTVRGRWGNWGADFHALNFQSPDIEGPRSVRGPGTRLFYQGQNLTIESKTFQASGWDDAFSSAAPPEEMPLLAYGTTVYAYLGVEPSSNERFAAFSFDKKREVARLSSSNEWSDWIPVTLQWRGNPIETNMRLCLIRLTEQNDLKVRILFDALNRTVVHPPDAAESLGKAVGPMVDFPDNWPAQLNRLPEERSVLLSEALLALEWHRKAARHLLSSEKPDVLIQDTYVPNQILESRWWLKHVDPDAPDYASTPAVEREKRLAELLEIYKGIDSILGAALESAPPETLFVLSSDHGILPIKREVLVNNLLAREGLLKFSIDGAAGEPRIDWENSKAIFLKMIGVYLNPAGLAGPWKHGSGPEYEELRERVSKTLASLKEGTDRVFEKILPWERAGELRLPKDRVPDLILAMRPGYALTEDMDLSGDLLRPSLQSGYKQAVIAEETPSLWTPFVAMGPGVKKGFRLKTPIENADQAPTLLHLLGRPDAGKSQGRILREILE